MKKRIRHRKLQFQRLANRELMAANITLTDAGVLQIIGSNAVDKAYVENSGSYVKATHNGKSERFSKTKVTAILFKGYGRDDYFNNRTSIPSRAYGHSGNDKLYGGSGNDYLNGGDGRDIVSGRGGNDKVYGGTGNDKLYGGDGNDYMAGYTGNDKLYGGDGNDTVRGNAGNDKLYGGRGNDKLQGGDGNDYMAGYTGNDKLYGGNGDDTVRGNAGSDKLYGGNGNDKLYGGTGNDHLEGDNGNDKLYGEAGHDDLYGDAGNDYLSGGSGRDGLYGGGSTSKDTLRGGSDADRFLTQYGDKIVDYSARSDARLHFVNGSARWNNSEIQTADQAFRKLHDKTRNVKLLRDPYTNRSLTFRKESDAWMDKNKGKTVAGNNYTNRRISTTKSWNYIKFKWDYFSRESRSRIIQLRDWNNSDSSERANAVDTVLHEIGHNWDADRPGEDHAQWKKFKKLNNASKKSSDYVRDYAKTDVYEDWASTFAHYVSNGKSSSSPMVRKKLSLVDSFFKDHT